MARNIDTITVVGAGAMGTIYASIFYGMEPDCVRFIADGERFERLFREGLIVNGRQFSIPVVRPLDKVPPSDLVIFAVKHHHLDEAITDALKLIGDETIVLSVMNGIESEERIGKAYGKEKILYAVAVGMDAVRVGIRINYASPGKILFGEAENPSPSERVERIQTLFDRAGIAWETPFDMVRALWWKFMINVGVNQASAALRAPYSAFQTSQEARELMESAMQEVITLAELEGIHLSRRDLEDWHVVLAGLNPLGKTSMLQDVEAGRKTEVEMFAGKVIELGKRHGTPTPVNQSLFDLIKAIEASY
jgi:2-dehydropantoate 2-reductase